MWRIEAWTEKDTLERRWWAITSPDPAILPTIILARYVWWMFLSLLGPTTTLTLCPAHVWWKKNQEVAARE
ncbi:hypothetical protein SCHPADRAFT_907214 [Schizopora paradoxa]|uniref:Uncharacterized protein n=1 Tax=Schizopora paradoxa TaxID=27342 RepID=A0A0H2RZ57_9AGAM|nr:hypothetical protein SCHPADRAFT_907214 [Schizopora paradoxa]